MQSRPLFAPWRMDYIKSVVKGEDDDKCFLCQAAAATTKARPSATPKTRKAIPLQKFRKD